jgi:tungstate transport system permease protein
VTLAAVEGLPETAREQLAALHLPYLTGARLALLETRSGVIAAAAAAFGRVIGEVGAVLVVGGNILGETRVLTTLIVQESRQGRFGIAIAAGMVLLALALVVNIGFERLRPA